MVQFGFYFLPVISILMIVLILRYAEPASQLIKKYLFFCSGWLIYLVIIQQLGLLESFELPPRVPMLIVIPVIIWIIWVTSTKPFQIVLQRTPLHLPIVLQSFRILVELLIYGAFLQGVFPQATTFQGLNYDILVGISALIMAFLISRKRIGNTAILAWNILSLMVLSLTVFSFVYSYYFTDYLVTGSREFVQFPYLLLAAVLLPVAVFLHVVSIRQVVMINKGTARKTP